MKRLKNPLLGILIVMGLGLVIAQSFALIDATKYLKPDTVTPALLKANGTTRNSTKFYRDDGRWESVGSSQITDASITGADLADGSVDLASNDVTGTLPATKVQPAAVYTFTWPQTISGTNYTGYVAAWRNALAIVSSENLIAVNTLKNYYLEAYLRGGDLQGGGYSSNAGTYAGVAMLDIQKRVIEPTHFMRHPGSTKTTFAANPAHSGDGIAIANGDTQFCVADGTGWDRSAVTSYHTMAWWPEQVSGQYGYSDGVTFWPPYTYSRKHSSLIQGAGQYYYNVGTWNSGGSGNCFTLTSAWNLGNVAVGVPVMNTRDSGTYNYSLALNYVTPNAWTQRTASINGMACDVTTEPSTQLWCGAAFISGIWLPNLTGTAGNQLISSFTVTAR